MRIGTVHVHLMGTVIEVQVEADDPDPLLRDAVDRLRVYEHRFSANDPVSELGAVNRASGRAPVTVHPELFELIAAGLEHSRAPDSMLNIAIGPLVQLWRIGFADARVPRQSEIDAALELCDPGEVDLDERSRSVFVRRPGARLDLGALAKGHIADLLIARVAEQGVRSAMVNLGGNVLAYGPSPRQEDGFWRVGLRHPVHPEGVLGQLSIEQGSVVTSGVYQRTLTSGDRVFHHILDPRTGHPVETDVTSLTVVSPRSVDGEIWTSRLFGRGVSTILQTVTAQPDCEAIVITDDLRLYATGGLRDAIDVLTEQ